VKLEAYFDRNLSQVNQIFYVSVTVMMVGFVFVLWAALLSLGQHAVTPTSKVAAIAGMVAQFIGATFMLIYRSTIAQASAFMLVLERINTVGMAVQVLDVMPDDALKSATHAEMAKLLLAGKDGSATVSAAAKTARK